MKWGVAFVALLCALVLLPGLRGPGPFDIHEAQDLQVAREMIDAHGALTPVLGSEPLFEKPLLAYAPEVLTLLAASEHAVEVSRAWRAVLAVLLVLLTAATTARHLGGRAGVCAAGVLATSLVLPLAARLDGTQLMASLLAWIAVDGFMHAWFGGRSGRDARLAISYATLACALVVAGPMAALWPLGAAAIYQGLTRRPGAWRALRPGAGVLIMAGLALPWYGAELERHGLEFLRHVAFYPYGLANHAGWLLGPFLAVSFAVVGFFPWSPLLPGALRHAAMWWRTPREAPAGVPAGAPDLAPLARELGEERAAHWFIACALAALLPLLLYPYAPLTASLPALPALAALCGRMLDHLIEDQARVAAPVRRGAQLLAMTGTVGAVLLLLVSSRVGDAAPAVRLLATTVFVTSWLPFLAALTGRFRLAALLMALPIAAGAPITSWRVVPIVEGYLTSRPVALAVEHRVPPRAALVLFDDPPPSLRFLTRHNLVRAEWYDGPLLAPRAADGFVYLAYRPAREESVRASVDRARGVLEVLARSPGLVLARVKAEAPR
jgi:4-amino-4-deoxy-L-arabinose transferase-like glycosyltransferase